MPNVLEPCDDGEIVIGAVEIKDATTNVRANVVPVTDASTADDALVTAAFAQGVAASDAAAVGNPVQVGGVYKQAGWSLTDGDVAALLEDIVGRLVVTQGTLQAGEDLASNVQGILQKPVASSLYSGTPGFNAGAATAISVKTTPGNLLFLRCSNGNAALRYLQLHNKASAPSAGETPILSFALPAGASAAIPAVIELGSGEFGPSVYFSTGIAIGISTTAGTYTAATAGDHQTNYIYV